MLFRSDLLVQSELVLVFEVVPVELVKPDVEVFVCSPVDGGGQAVISVSSRPVVEEVTPRPNMVTASPFSITTPSSASSSISATCAGMSRCPYTRELIPSSTR